MWNDTDLPLGYLITFLCYGTWLHGYERGSIDRYHNRYKSPYVPRSDRRRNRNRRELKSEPAISAEQRQSVERTVREVCAVNKRLIKRQYVVSTTRVSGWIKHSTRWSTDGPTC